MRRMPSVGCMPHTGSLDGAPEKIFFVFGENELNIGEFVSNMKIPTRSMATFMNVFVLC
ncbi:MAG: hypothetical protein UY62_C0001G0005 [Parcubacteria group bacterium GW2011_GWF2_50_9]|nr:MAG: hypothetical protein UY62_C0001G0005 [Parcubacteria group bacterium GW2011_GWF2_50_9]